MASPLPDGAPASVHTGAELRAGLQALLDAKERQLQQAGALGQRVLAQQAELEHRARALQDDAARAGEMDAQARERYRELADAVRAWDAENAALGGAFGSAKTRSPAMQPVELAREEPERARPAASSAQSRRAKNAAHRQDDVEFAFEIGSGLLTEVRRLQSLLGERDKAIQDIKDEKDDAERTVDGLQDALKQQEQSTDKYKEENWNLEVMVQELRVQLSDTTANVQRLEGDAKRLTRQLGQAREQADRHKSEAGAAQSALDELRARHDADAAQARKHAASLQRDKSDLQSSLDQLKAEAARGARRLAPGRFGVSPQAHNGVTPMLTPHTDREDDDVFGTHGASTNRRRGAGAGYFDAAFADDDSEPDAPASPTRAPNHPANEVEALQQRLAHAQRQINTLKGTLAREKEAKIEYRRRALESPAPAAHGREADVGEQENADPASAAPARTVTGRRGTPYRRGRGARGGSLIDRLQRARRRPDENDGEEEEDEDADPTPLPPSPPPVPALPRRASFQGAEADDDEDDEPELPDMSRPASIDGMDPAFANIFRRANSGGVGASPRNGGSPLRPGLGTLRRRARGGAAFAQARPASLVGAPEALAAELFGDGMVGMDSVAEDAPEVETADFGCQTDDAPPPTPEKVYITLPAPEPEKVYITLPAPEPEKVYVHLPAPEPEKIYITLPAPPAPEPEKVYITLPAPEPEKVVVTVEVPAPRAPSADAGVQAEPEPVPEILYASVDAQTDAPPPPPVYAGVDTQTDPEPVVEPPPALVYASADVQTDAEPEPEPTPAPLPVPVPVVVEEPPAPTVPEKVYASMEMQTDAEPEPAPAPVPIPEPVVVKPVLADAEMQTDAEPVVVPPVRAESGVQHEDQRVASGVQHEDLRVASGVQHEDLRAESGVQYEDVRAETGVQHEDVVPAKVYADGAMATEPEAAPTPTKTAVAEVQTDAQATVPVTSVVAATLGLGLGRPSNSTADESRRQTITQRAFASASAQRIAASSGSVPVPEDDEAEGEPGSVTMITPATSMGDYATARGDESFDRTATPGQLPGAFFAPRTTYSQAGVQHEPAAAREIKEMSIQTDEWVPTPAPALASAPAPAPAAAAAPASGHQSFRMTGLGLQQFQYISPPASAGPTTTTMPASVPPSPATAAPASIIRPRTSASDRRQSIESALSAYVDDPTPRGRLTSAPSASPAVDKTRPPMMMLPPPPRAPPPPSSMPPPSFVPDRARHASDGPPGRPSSPPPPELLQRATTPTFGSVRSHYAHQFGSMRVPGGSMPPGALASRPSTNSFRSAGAHAHMPASLQNAFAAHRELSQTSLQSAGSLGSARSSVSSDHPYYHQRGASGGAPGALGAAAAPRGSGSPPSAEGGVAGSTDPNVIHAITQTMIGEYLFKYTRKPIGKGYGDKRHKRFFWVHPYTKTLYWSDTDPGSSSASESSAKSAYIEAVRSVLDPNPLPPGLYQYSVVVSTPHREMKITAPTKERHDIWLNALKYLLARPSTVAGAMGGTMPRGGAYMPQSPGAMSAELGAPEDARRAPLLASPQSFRSRRSAGGEWNTTPRGKRSRSQMSIGGSIGKRSGTPAAEYLRYGGDGPTSPERSFEHVDGLGGEDDDEDLDFELHEGELSDGGFEGLENVRACCDGRHTVGGHHHHHHHHHEHAQVTRNGSQHSHLTNGHYHAPPPPPPPPRERSRVRGERQQQQQQHLDARPTSPAFSFRSRAGSATSDGGGLFGGKLRFGSRRMKTPVPQDA